MSTNTGSSDTTVTTISAEQAVQCVEAGGTACVIDVRTDFEVASECVPGAVHIELGQVEQRVDEVRAVPRPRLLLCAKGGRASQARERLARLGVEDIRVIEGGLAAFRAAGGGTETAARPSMSLERQVRIAAGLLVLLGTGLSLTVHAAFIGLAMFVGAGLVFAGVTDTCAMGLLLARMPWNRVAATP